MEMLSLSYLRDYFALTHTRGAPWFIGFIVGYLLSIGLDGKGKVLSKRTIAICWSAWFFAIIVQIVSMFYISTVLGVCFENTFRKLAWVYVLAWTAYSCHFGYGGHLNTFLSLPIFQIFSRLAYSSYLMHGFLILTLKGSMRSAIHFTHFELIVQTCGFWLLAQFVALLFNLTIESPITILLTRSVKKKKE
ncbi:hypothetical protein PPYR_12231 [Photinus pyralis]|uniref:Acyltransferase 3 domain-containing protein n=3 Tax=Photinus pyralis TaxID=7054 RepID=A0A5N4ADJ8_PHOPY|nr:hypothetical protein PPYR_12231 [Photinus pyralis]